MGYLTVLHVRLGAKIGDLHAKDSNSFRNRVIVPMAGINIQVSGKLVTQLLLFFKTKSMGDVSSISNACSALLIWKLLLCVDSLGSCMNGSAHAGAPTAEFSACLQL